LINIIRIFISIEFFFVLFLFAGSFKSLLSFIPLDATVIFMLISVALAIYRALLNGINIKSINVLIIYIIFISYVLFSLIYTSDFQYGLDKALRFSILTTWGFIGVLLIVNKEEAIIKFYKSIIIFALFLSLLAIPKFLTQEGYSMVSVAGSNYLSLAKIVSLGSIILICLFFFNKQRKKLIPFLFFICFVFVLFISGARMPLISFILLIPIIMMLKVKIQNGKIIYHKGVKYFTFIILLGLALLVPFYQMGYFKGIIFRLSSLSLINSDASSLERLDRYASSYRLWVDNIIFGGGIGSFNNFYQSGVYGEYPHNIFLEVLSELGLFGFITLLVLILLSILNCFYFSKINTLNRKYFMVNLVCFIYLFLNANVSGDINDNKILFAFLALLNVTLTKKAH
jgi:O-antigen ligase